MDTMKMENIGSLIRQHRKSKGITMAELGSMVGVSEQAIAHYELGRRFPSFEMVEKISNALCVSLEVFLDDYAFYSGKSKRIKSLPQKWIDILSKNVLPSHTDKVLEQIVNGHEFQKFLVGLLYKMKRLSDVDRVLLLHLIQDIYDSSHPVGDVKFAHDFIVSRWCLLNDERKKRAIGYLDGLLHEEKSEKQTKGCI